MNWELKWVPCKHRGGVPSGNVGSKQAFDSSQRALPVAPSALSQPSVARCCAPRCAVLTAAQSSGDRSCAIRSLHVASTDDPTLAISLRAFLPQSAAKRLFVRCCRTVLRILGASRALVGREGRHRLGVCVWQPGTRVASFRARLHHVVLTGARALAHRRISCTTPTSFPARAPRAVPPGAAPHA